jgi:hypothetical protein
MIDSGKIEELEDKEYGLDAWKYRSKRMIPDDERTLVPALFLTFIIATPILVLSLIFNPIIKLFKK